MLSGAACMFALWKGGKPERLAAMLFVAGIIATLLSFGASSSGTFDHFSAPIATIDATMFVMLLALAFTANRYWTIATAGFQLTTLFGHILKLLAPSIIPQSYLFVTAVWSWPMMAALALGTSAHCRRLLTQGADADWKPSLVWPQSRTTRSSG